MNYIDRLTAAAAPFAIVESVHSRLTVKFNSGVYRFCVTDAQQCIVLVKAPVCGSCLSRNN